MCLILILACMPLHSRAEDHYPVVPVRYDGTNQGWMEACSAHASVNALEHAFAQRGYPIKLSLFYRHAKIWQNLDRRAHSNLGLVYNSEDIRILNAAGSFIPEYMWPEDQPEGTNQFPEVSQQALIDPNFPTAESLGFGETDYRDSIEAIKQHVRNNEAVVLQINDDISLENDSDTGLPQRAYSQVARKILGKIDHDIAVVGFDDSLNGFIVRNSGNGSPFMMLDQAQNRRLSEVRKFRLRISKQNLSGYEIIPYQYVQDLGARGAVFRVFRLNYDAYAAAYFKFQNEYRTVAVPYFCDNGNSYYKMSFKEAILSLATLMAEKHFSSEEKAKAKVQFMKALLQESRRNGLGTIFDLAKLPTRRGDMRRVDQFFNGDFSRFYCGQDKQWPGPRFNRYRAEDKDIDAILFELGAGNTTVAVWQRWFSKFLTFPLVGETL